MIGDRPPSQASAVRMLLIVSVVMLGVIIYSIGWTTTDISLDEVQDTERSAQLSRALRELLSPNIFTQDTESELVSVNFLATRNCPEDVDIEQPEFSGDEPYITVSNECGFSDDMLVVEGFNYTHNPRNSGIIRWRLTNNTIPITRFELDSDGHFREEITIPRLGRVSGDNIHQIEAESFIPTGSIRFSETTKTVVDKMVETIFLALMATTLALPIAFALSFLAAHNLMRQLTMPLGPVLIGFIFFPVGWWLGSTLLAQAGQFGVDSWGAGSSDFDIGGAIATVLSGGVLAGLFVGIGYLRNSIEASEVTNLQALRRPGDTPSHVMPNFARSILRVANGIIALTFVMLIVGISGGLAIWLGSEVQSISIFSDFGNMVATLGELVELIVKIIGGLLGGFYLASITSTLSAPLFKLTRDVTIVEYTLGAVLSALVTGMILYGLAEFSHQAALLILLVPVAASFIGSQILPMIYNVFFPGDKYVKAQGTRKWILNSLSLAGAIIIFIVVFVAMNAARGIVDGRRPLAEEIDVLSIGIKVYSYRALLIGFGLGAVMGGLSGVNSSFPFGLVVYNTTRTILNTLRSIEPLIMGIVFVIWVGIGPFAGMLALALHSIASLGKLYSEQVENIDQGPIEAVLATGANRLQMIVYAVVPQIVPPYIAFTMYRWDINVRMSTIIGFVGGGGIGFLLSQQINQLRYQEAGVAVLAIAIVVTILDYTSAYIREKLI
jgi:phosphonate ABC transporter permease subunit PhnE